MAKRVTHFVYVPLCTERAPCGAHSDRHDYSERDEDVTCAKCLHALGRY